MCGICGVFSPDGHGIDCEIIKRMTTALRHRGPDDDGIVFGHATGSHVHAIEARVLTCSNRNVGGDLAIAMGHQRLSIIDLSDTAHQPMCNEDRSIWIVYNGEIYNFRELREELEARGHAFNSQSDTEVVIHAYEEWGTDALRRFRGMFAFAIWDHPRGRLFLARDRLGQKPICYYHKGGRLLFASEIKSILEDPSVDRRICYTALHEYLAYQYIPSPRTIFEGIEKLPPGHYLLCDRRGNVSVHRYWELSYKEKLTRPPRQLEGLCDEVFERLKEAVKIRLISDVPLGAFLSGGVDSSAIVALMAQLTNQPVRTFSIGFHEKDYDELRYARQVARQFGTNHKEFVVRPNVIEILPKLIWYYNEPFADSSAIPTYYVAQQTSQHVKVVLTGDGGDENFAGYNRYIRNKWIQLLSIIPEQLRGKWLIHLLRRIPPIPSRSDFFANLARLLTPLTSSPGRNYGLQMLVFDAAETGRLYSDSFISLVNGADPLERFQRWFDESDADNLIDKTLYIDTLSYLPDCLLVKMDIATMANSLEARSPFLDHEFMEFVATIPARLKLKASHTKYVLKRAMERILPRSILNRGKMGFGIPIDHWFRDALRDYIYDILLDDASLRRGYFRRDRIETILDEHTRLGFNHSARIWALLNLELWHQAFIDRKGQGPCRNSLL